MHGTDGTSIICPHMTFLVPPPLPLLLLRKLTVQWVLPSGADDFLPAYKTKLNNDIICCPFRFIYLFFSYLAFSVGIELVPPLKIKPYHQVMSCGQTLQVMTKNMMKIQFWLTELCVVATGLHPVLLVKSYSPRGCWALRSFPRAVREATVEEGVGH